MSYSDSIPIASMNLNQMVDDAAEVSNYLRIKFHKEKIYILGHSPNTGLALTNLC